MQCVIYLIAPSVELNLDLFPLWRREDNWESKTLNHQWHNEVIFILLKSPIIISCSNRVVLLVIVLYCSVIFDLNLIKTWHRGINLQVADFYFVSPVRTALVQLYFCEMMLNIFYHKSNLSWLSGLNTMSKLPTTGSFFWNWPFWGSVFFSVMGLLLEQYWHFYPISHRQAFELILNEATCRIVPCNLSSMKKNMCKSDENRF